MIRYRKGKSPKELDEAAATPGANWATGFHERDAVREAVVRDQRGLCAYCQRRITADDQHRPQLQRMKIEHWMPRSHPSAGADAQFRWTNLLGVCSGASGRERHCDTHRGDATLFLHPVDGEGPDPRAHLHYEDNRTGNDRDKDGGIKVVSAKADDRVKNDIKVLNLNASVLKRGRSEALEGFKRLAAKKQYDSGALRRQLDDYEQRSTAPEYFEVIRAYIQRKLRQQPRN